MAYRFGRLEVSDPLVGPLVLEGDGFAAAGDPIRLALDAAVQAHLGVDASEAQQAREIWRHFKESLDGAYASEVDPEDLERVRAATAVRARTQLELLLGPQRSNALQQLSCRIRGGDALTDPELAEKLDLNDEQRSDLVRLARDNEASTQRFYRELSRERIDQHTFQQRALRHESEASERLLAVLTPAQRARFEAFQRGDR